MNDRKTGKFNFGFTLIEILVAVSIIGILSAVIAVNSIDSGKQSRDTERQADLRTLQSAIELYKNKYGRYPAQCAGGSGGWSGQQSTNFACSGGDTQYIVGHVDVNDWDGDGDITERFSFAPEFISVLPIDPKKGTGDYGYVYRTNANGTVYKLMAMNSVESESVSNTHLFKSCDFDTNLGSGDPRIDGFCVDPSWNSGSTPDWCKETDITGRFQKSYAVWGGVAPFTFNKTYAEFIAASNANKIIYIGDTTNVICK